MIQKKYFMWLTHYYENRFQPVEIDEMEPLDLIEWIKEQYIQYFLLADLNKYSLYVDGIGVSVRDGIVYDEINEIQIKFTIFKM